MLFVDVPIAPLPLVRLTVDAVTVPLPLSVIDPAPLVVNATVCPLALIFAFTAIFPPLAACSVTAPVDVSIPDIVSPAPLKVTPAADRALVVMLPLFVKENTELDVMLGRLMLAPLVSDK